MPITCQVTGQITDIFSVSLEVVTLEFTHKESEPFISGSGALVSLSPKRVKCVGGVIDVALVPGEYSVRILDTRSTRELAVRIGVPNTATAALADIVEAPVPKRLDAAEEAVLDARSARDAAIEAADTATTKATEVEENASATLTAKNAAEAASVLAEASKNTAVAAQSAANLSATAAEEKAVEASSSAGNAANSATSASESASAAEDAANAAAYSESASATSASNANISATSAANSATSASTSKDSAATSAAASASSATSAGNAVVAAQAARDATLAALDSFDDRYLGAFAEEPSVDNDGEPLQKGALFYHDAAENAGMRVYTGRIWVPAYSSLDGALLVENNLSDLADAVQSRQNLGMGAGDDVHFSSVTANLFGNASTATLAVASTKLQSARNILLSGGVTGSASFDGSSDVTLNVQVADNSHAHTIANVTGLQNALDLKLDTSGNAASATKLADPFTLSVSGGASGSVSLDGSGDVALDLSLESLPALSATISDASAVVAKCIFSLADMSDGGAAIRNARHTSWHQAWGPFPEKFGVYAEARKITIRDLTKAGAPVWLTVSGGEQDATNYAISGLSGSPAQPVSDVEFTDDGRLLITGGAGYSSMGLMVWDFPNDRWGNHGTTSAWSGWVAAPLAQINTLSRIATGSLPNIGSGTVNAVASFVYPDAPCDPETGLPIATIAVGHSAGVSVVKADGSVQAVGGTTYSINAVWFDDEGALYWTSTGDHNLRGKRPPFTDTSTDFTVAAYKRDDGPVLSQSTSWCGSGGGLSASLGGNKFAARAASQPVVAVVSDAGAAVSQLGTDFADTQFKNCVLSALNGNDDADLVGGELIANGGATGFTVGSSSTFVDNGDGTATITTTDLSGRNCYVIIPTVVGQWYRFVVKVSGASVGRVRAGTSIAGYNYCDIIPTGTYTEYEFWFKATTTTAYITAFGGAAGASEATTFGEMSLRLADPDRSVSGKGLAVYGTVQKSEAVAGSGGLMAYSGFSPTNRLEQPYNSALAFGTGDFTLTAYVVPTTVDAQLILDRADASLTASSRLNMAITGTLANLFCRVGTTTATAPYSFTAGVGYHVAVSKSGSTANFYVNGRNIGSASGLSGSVSGDHSCTVMSQRNYTNSPQAGAQVQVYSRALSSDEISLLHRLQRAALYGKTTLRSGDIKSIAADPYTGDLHVLTAVGRQVFDGKTLQETGFEAITGKTKLAVHNGTVSLS